MVELERSALEPEEGAKASLVDLVPDAESFGFLDA